ncbi:MAG TPA: carboxypeptidase-like regulatory domain-containing protein [Lentimicrobium sp.]|nr:carboxypeptidase-like regulatory domain-containing protein [Lentimicrobium sp.]
MQLKFTGILWKSVLLNLFLVFGYAGYTQEMGEIYGKITDDQNNPVPLANISLSNQPGGTISKMDGTYQLKIPANKEVIVAFTYVGYTSQFIRIVIKSGERKLLDRKLLPSTTQLPGFVITDEKIRTSTLTPLDPKLATTIPTASGGLEALIKTFPGVSSNNELSSQYSVRGGNYDENLVYVNDVEIYRPFLVRSGQQEGLSFLNSDLVSSILFSAGGFDARYGDKMSSVLDIRYKRPTITTGSLGLSLLGASLHIEGSSKDRRFMYLLGFRNKTNQYLLKTLETKGDYKPSFNDLQGMMIFEVNPKLEFSFFGNYAGNKYQIIPESRETSFGTVNEALQLRVFFGGSEIDKFNNYMGAFTTHYKPKENLSLKLILSSFQTIESETFDITGQYWIGELETDQSKSNFGELVSIRGIGTYHNHARNYLEARVTSIEHRGMLLNEEAGWMWGLKYQTEDVNDRLNEWVLNDSAGFTLPVHQGIPGEPGNQSDILLQDIVKTSIDLNSVRTSGFIQHSREFGDESGIWNLIIGVRGNYWNVNDQLLISPRASISYKPDWKNDLVFRLSAGMYYQPPFYRELRNKFGILNTELKAQSSFHIVLGSDFNFLSWGRPFKFTAETYYKYLQDLVPYDIDNVRIRYFATNSAKGYATGIDLKVNGEFVKGIESWASLSVMQTKEDLENDNYYNYYNDEGELIIPGYTTNNTVVDSTLVEKGFIPRPTDQRITFSTFFQDYLPKNPTYKMHLNFVFGTGLPYSPPGTIRSRNMQRMPAYIRVDIGFSKQLLGANRYSETDTHKRLKFINDAWLSLEVLNLLQVSNTVSYIWVKDVMNRQYAVPNYLTPRQLNLKLIVNF